MEKNEKLGQKKVSKFNLHFVWGHFSRKQAVALESCELGKRKKELLIAKPSTVKFLRNAQFFNLMSVVQKKRNRKMKLLTAPVQNHRAQKTSLLQQSLRNAALRPGNASSSPGRLPPGPRGARKTLAVMETPKGPVGKLESILPGTQHQMEITWSFLPMTSTIAATRIAKKLAKTATEVPRLRKEQTSR